MDTAEHLSLFSSIKQGNDTCQLQSVCVPIPLINGDPQIVIYPKCYEVSTQRLQMYYALCRSPDGFPLNFSEHSYLVQHLCIFFLANSIFGRIEMLNITKWDDHYPYLATRKLIVHSPTGRLAAATASIFQFVWNYRNALCVGDLRDH